MKTYDFVKAKQLIEQNKEQLLSASLDMHEDWFWTAETVWTIEEGYIHNLPDNADELHESFIKARKEGLSMFLKEKDKNGFSKSNPDYDKYTTHMIGGIYGSSWATPTLQLLFNDGNDKMLEVYKGESDEIKYSNDGLGCLSGPVQNNITPITKS